MTAKTFASALGIWVVMAVCAVLNGILREAVLLPSLGETLARPLSAALLLVVVYLLTWVLLRWRGPLPGGTAWGVGLMWLALTVAFEVLLGRLRGMTGPEILVTYSPYAPTHWDVVLLGILFAPPVVNRVLR